jgi:outer membrane protein
LSLTQAIDIGVAQSPAFASQRAQYRAIAAKYGAEKGALLPNVSGNASVSRGYGGAQTRTTTPPPGISPGAPFTTISGTVTLTQLIYDGGRVIAGLRTAKESDIAGRDTLIRELQTLAFNIAQAYYGVLQADATVSSDASLVRQFESQENSVSAQIRTGAAARSDLAAAQFQTAQARGALITAQGAVITAQSTFATTLGLDADTLVTPQMTAGTPVKTLSYAQSLKEALATRPDYVAAEHTVESSKENLRFAKLARFPVLNLNASAGYSGSLPAATPRLNSAQSLGASLSIPIYDQGLTNFNVAVAASQLDQSNAALITTKLTVESDVRGALANLISARAALVQAQAELQSGQVNSQAVQARYRVGAATITDLVTAEATLATAQRDDVSAIYNERIAEERYSFALGTSDLKL